jgi:hypothetical protein
MALSHLWQFFSAPMGVPFETIGTCEGIFWNTYRGAGWEAHPARPEILGRAIRSALLERRENQHNAFDGMLVALCQYPEHDRANYKLLLKVLDGAIDIYKFGTAQRLSMLYHPHATDKEVQKLNREIFEKLVALLADENQSVSDGAGIALGNIGIEYARVGEVPGELSAVLKGEGLARVDQQAKVRMSVALRDIAKLAPPKIPPDVRVLAHPWDDHIGKKIVTHAMCCYRDGTHGASVEVRNRRIYIDGLDAWPDSVAGKEAVLITGTLTKAADFEVFRYREGKPFEGGLPVPEPHSLDKARERYVLKDATWQVRKLR